MNIEALKKIRVICVDDEAEALEQMHLALGSFCQATLCVNSSHKALELLDSEGVDIVVTDVRMPGTSGIELLKTIKQRYPEIPVIIVSAHSEAEYLLDAIRLKADGYLLKPLNLYELLDLLSKIATGKVLQKELSHKNILLKVLGAIGGRRVQIVEYILNHIDDDRTFHGTYDEVAAALSASKPTVVGAFQDLIEHGVLIRIKNGVYQLNPQVHGIHDTGGSPE